MTVNLHEKYSKQVADKFYKESIILGKTSNEWKPDGVKSIILTTITTYASNAYSRSGSNRYGTPKDVEDTQQTLSMTQDRGVSLIIDKGDYKQSNYLKKVGHVIKLEMREQLIPESDKYALNAWAFADGVGTGTNASITESNILKEITKARSALVNAKCFRDGDVYMYIGTTLYSTLLGIPEYTTLEKLGTKAVEDGVVGKVRGIKVVEVPDEYMPSGNNSNKVQFLVTNKRSVLFPIQIKDMIVHDNPPGINGSQIDFRYLYDAWVVDARKGGVYTLLDKANTPTA